MNAITKLTDAVGIIDTTHLRSECEALNHTAAIRHICSTTGWSQENATVWLYGRPTPVALAGTASERIIAQVAAKTAAARSLAADDGITIPRAPIPFWPHVEMLAIGWTGPGEPPPMTALEAAESSHLRTKNLLNNARRRLALASAALAAIDHCRDAHWRDTERPHRQRALEKAEIEFEVAQAEHRVAEAWLAGLTAPALAAE